ncbi:hypothetical protein INT47_001176 [Mucor saturninus]|uniref:Uncharacterized protein n=1 Tax=Mucor saturninus TaxID=64648 RepID=A0A8H7VCM6_9FUNG|nr:hypothetical protein INT47_001176 [Mucor saturninus]
MSTRTVKTHNNHKANFVKGNNKANFVNAPPPTVKKQQHTIQQPNKKKLQATPNNKHGRKKIVEDVEEDYYYQPRKSSEQVYAGPTFNNAPAPSALPIPAFNARGSPINYPQPLYSTHSFQQQSMDLMNLIAPQKVITAYELEKTNLALSEIQRGLRSMLKIES